MNSIDEDRIRLDPFYGGKAPRSLLCLPISSRGEHVGVLLLSSSSTTSTQLESTTSKEVIAALATLAVSTSMNFSFTHRLQEEVAQRTEALNAALQAKTAFLSQTSHDLRTPLSAVLVSQSIFRS
jgi:GAF domain-containing protein